MCVGVCVASVLVVCVFLWFKGVFVCDVSELCFCVCVMCYVVCALGLWGVYIGVFVLCVWCLGVVCV